MIERGTLNSLTLRVSYVCLRQKPSRTTAIQMFATIAAWNVEYRMHGIEREKGTKEEERRKTRKEARPVHIPVSFCNEFENMNREYVVLC